MFWKKSKKRIFLDYASMTPIAKEVKEVMAKYESGEFANPSALYAEGLAAKEVIQNAKQNIAGILKCRKEEVFFTGGGTESNNLALLGVFESVLQFADKPHIITTIIEHPSILEVCKEIERRGGEVTRLPVTEEGIVRVKDIREALRPNTVLVSVMYTNNEIGTIQPIREIGKVIRDYRLQTKNSYPYFHTDASQASLYLSLDVEKLGVDMMTLDGIKMYGPRGVGLLYKKSNIEINPIMFGGGQERGLRSGTENVSAIAGFAKALEMADFLRENESNRLKDIRDYGIEKILKAFPQASLNGSQENRLPNNINICSPGLDAEFAVISLDVAGISASHSSSCRTLAENSSSYVIEALAKPDCSQSSLRFTLGRESTKVDIDILIEKLKSIIK